MSYLRYLKYGKSSPDASPIPNPKLTLTPNLAPNLTPPPPNP